MKKLLVVVEIVLFSLLLALAGCGSTPPAEPEEEPAKAKLIAPFVIVSSEKSTIKLNWNKVDGATGYKIYYSTSEAAPSDTVDPSSVITIDSGDILSADIENIDPGATYFIWAKATGDGIDSDWAMSLAKKMSNYNANLSSLEVIDYTLTPAFSPDVYNYSLTSPIASDVEVITVSADPDDINAVISGDGCQSPFAEGQEENTITVRVTAEDGVNYNEYTIHITRGEPVVEEEEEEPEEEDGEGVGVLKLRVQHDKDNKMLILNCRDGEGYYQWHINGIVRKTTRTGRTHIDISHLRPGTYTIGVVVFKKEHTIHYSSKVTFTVDED
ncbi:MAG: cadherin-like beta sandwich domain-containing protein [Treponema sp.]|jgi:hypothetical protein|nr:cadherin-like beta sandwich domain-containing protein [Treponema sp.]